MATPKAGGFLYAESMDFIQSNYIYMSLSFSHSFSRVFDFVCYFAIGILFVTSILCSCLAPPVSLGIIKNFFLFY